jgi:hypothetical protein
MKATHFSVARLAVVLISLLTAVAAMADPAVQKEFDLLKTLSGSWQGIGSQGQPVKVSYRVTANGSALMSEIQGAEDMVSMFHLDGDRLLMTHYCAAGNQPRMQAQASPDGKTVTFDFLDATNLATPQATHMHRVVFTVIDANHHTEEWDATMGGKEMKEVFDLRRQQ